MVLTYPENYRLAVHGDSIEQRLWRQFIMTEFPSYERFWQRYVLPTTARPYKAPAGLRSEHMRPLLEKELAAEGLGDHDVCISQLHYSIVCHLGVAYDLKQNRALGWVDFVHCIVRLAASIDIAEELLQRHRYPYKYDAWSEASGKDARHTWRGTHPADTAKLKPLREYRNHLIHGRVSMMTIVSDVPLIPRIGREILYLNWWKSIKGALDPGTSSDFATPQTIATEAWNETLSWLEARWKVITP